MSGLIHEPKHQHEIEAAKASHKHPVTNAISGENATHGHLPPKDQIETHHLPKGHHEETEEGKPINPVHSGANPQRVEAEYIEERDKEAAIRQVNQLEKLEKAGLSTTSGSTTATEDQHHSHTTDKKDLTDTVYNFVK